jgi:hypothetical protein
MMRDRADQLIRVAERIFPPGCAETVHKETVHKESGPGTPADPA